MKRDAAVLLVIAVASLMALNVQLRNYILTGAFAPEYFEVLQETF